MPIIPDSNEIERTRFREGSRISDRLIRRFSRFMNLEERLAVQLSRTERSSSRIIWASETTFHSQLNPRFPPSVRAMETLPDLQVKIATGMDQAQASMMDQCVIHLREGHLPMPRFPRISLAR